MLKKIKEWFVFIFEILIGILVVYGVVQLTKRRNQKDSKKLIKEIAEIDKKIKANKEKRVDKDTFINHSRADNISAIRRMLNK